MNEFDPEGWTEKELLKHLYREIKRLDEDIKSNSDFDSSVMLRLHKLEMDIQRIDVMIQERDIAKKKRNQRNAMLITIIGLAISYAAYING
tara:strand:- start:1352 stop:1624 length:273 start_codon:yes stop_codon:yes gene_type:complete